MDPSEGTTPESHSSTSVYSKLQRIAELARRMPDAALTTLAHHIDIEWLREAHRRTRKDGATGVDGQTAAEYGENLEDNLQSLLDRAKSGTYRAPPVRRVHIPKGDGTQTRPIGIPTFEDKILQRAVMMVLEAIFEQDFVDWSYGFRPGRSQHQALEATRSQLMEMHGGWLIEIDVQSFFDEIDHGHLRAIVGQRVRDGVLTRLIGKWLKAGVMEDGERRRMTAGSPQGGVVSPLLANVFLHEVFDRWFEREVKPRMKGAVFAVRFADDILIAVQDETDVRRVMQVLPKRFGKYGLRLHPDKTRVLDMRHPWKRGGRPGEGRTFDFLGLTHYWGLSRKGNWVIKRKTAKGRLRRAIGEVWKWCRGNRHRPVDEQRAVLASKLRGHYNYYGVRTNFRSLGAFYWTVLRAWQHWLNRRSDSRAMPWKRFYRLLEHYPLPKPRVTHAT